MSANYLIYGANGYTGALTARLALEAGHRPLLAGRSAEKVRPLAEKLGLEARVFGLDDAAAVDRGLGGVAAVLHCAGPFSRTARPMAEACLRTGVHYLDITGEVEVFESLMRRDQQARAAGVMLMPGAGFDVVPSDCLAAHLKRRLPEATHLVLAFRAVGGRVSRGTATTMVENLHKGGLIRQDGALKSVPAGAMVRQVDFGRGPVTCMGIPWGDVSTAFFSTRIPNIEVYTPAPWAVRAGAKASRYLGGLLKSGPVQGLMKRIIDRRPEGPSEQERATAVSLLWGEVRGPGGAKASARLRTPEGYTLTAQASLLIVGKVLDGQAKPGYQTPSSAYGPDLVLEIAGVERTDLD
jgi:short subunit dehydrogenase-like uncharacterized protein